MRQEARNVPNTSIAEIISDKISRYISNEFSFALWRLPHSTIVNLAASDKPEQWSNANLEDAKTGFLFSPFEPNQKKLFLPADEFHTFESGKIVTSPSVTHLNRPVIASTPPPAPYHTAKKKSVGSPDENDFRSLVSKCRSQIEKGFFEKVVPSRSKAIPLPDNFQIADIFKRLCERYPNAMISVFSNPTSGTWVGASPELLVSVNRQRRFHTVAVAGTQPYNPKIDLRSVTWTQKDIEEQALVERYIIGCFKKIRLREFEEHGPKTVIAGNLLHLKTDFEVDMVATNYPQLGSVMLKLLHPTSAVCGTPLDASLQFLREHEGYNREFYSGYLGPVNIDEESHLYVNLRCMQLFDGEAILYAGAGVLAESDPEKEWLETELKMNTLLQIIRQ